jgi:hypothetical protein
MANVIYKGEDSVIVIDLDTVVFSTLIDVFVGVNIGGKLVKTYKKSTGGVVAVSGDVNQCKFKIVRSDSQTWGSGMLALVVTLVFSDSEFPDGKHVVFENNIVELSNSTTSDL